jgi:alpha-amylase
MQGVLTLLFSYVSIAFAAPSSEWRGRSIYQVFVDRFAKTDGSVILPCDVSKAQFCRGHPTDQVSVGRSARTDRSNTSPCDVSKEQYCGGTWQGLIDQLDYINNMGFTAVCPHSFSPIQLN